MKATGLVSDSRRRLAMKLPLLSIGLAADLSAAANAGGTPQGLVIGNNDYRLAPRLANAVNDAKLVDRTLRTLGVDSSLAVNQTNAQLSGLIEAFVRRTRATSPSVLWFFYCGHGASIQGRDLLLGTDTTFGTPESLLRDGYALGDLRTLLDQTRAAAAIVVVDACRDNPFVATRSVAGPGLGLMLREWAGSLTAYSTAPYSRALDWPERPNGPYAHALCDALLDRRPRSIETVFMEVSDSVYRSTDQRQKPGYYSELRQPIVLMDGHVSLTSDHSVQSVASRTGSPDASTTRSMAPRMYRADLKLDDRYLGTRNEEWEDQIARIESAAGMVDRTEANKVIVKSGGIQCSDFDRGVAGTLLMEGRVVPKDRDRASRILTVAAMRGYVPAQIILGELQYERQRYDQSLRWLGEASLTGMPRPMLSLAQLNFEGRGTPRDDQQGIKLLMETLKQTVGINPQRPPP